MRPMRSRRHERRSKSQMRYDFRFMGGLTCAHDPVALPSGFPRPSTERAFCNFAMEVDVDCKIRVIGMENRRFVAARFGIAAFEVFEKLPDIRFYSSKFFD